MRELVVVPCLLWLVTTCQQLAAVVTAISTPEYSADGVVMKLIEILPYLTVFATGVLSDAERALLYRNKA